jgi:hypothetical protein
MPELPVRQPMCHTCKHWNSDLTCKAFPQGIPLGILTNDINHARAVAGDHGVQYERHVTVIR